MIPQLLMGWDLVVVIVVLALLFGGSKLAGLGKSAGTAIREFKQETTSLHSQDAQSATASSVQQQVNPPAV